eukprot:CFRG6723T1
MARIMGGSDQVSPVPWMVALRNLRFLANGSTQAKTYCGASLINKDWILSAGHCVFSDGVSNKVDNEAWIGGLDLSNPDEFQIRSISEYICHPDFVFDTLEGVHNDICVMKLNASVTLETVILNDLASNEIPGEMTTVIGFGTLSEVEGSSNTLQTVDLPLQPVEVCESTFNYQQTFFLEKEMLCAGFPTGQLDACLGDSGGPQSFNDSQIGLVSWGDGCGRPDKYGVYTKVSFYVEWIEETTGVGMRLASLEGGLSDDSSGADETQEVGPTSTISIEILTESTIAADIDLNTTNTRNDTESNNGTYIDIVKDTVEFVSMPEWCVGDCIAIETILPAQAPAGTFQFLVRNLTANSTTSIGYRGPIGTALIVSSMPDGEDEIVTIGPVTANTSTYMYSTCIGGDEEAYLNYFVPEDSDGGKLLMWMKVEEGCELQLNDLSL